ncbi:hypothetical protein ACMFMG_004651 [Clarireedia jacksonii]
MSTKITDEGEENNNQNNWVPQVQYASTTPAVPAPNFSSNPQYQGAASQSFSIASGSYQSYSDLPSPEHSRGPYDGPSGTNSYVAESINLAQPSESSYAAPTIRTNSAWTRITRPMTNSDMTLQPLVMNPSQGASAFSGATGSLSNSDSLYDPKGPYGDGRPVIDLWRNVCRDSMVSGGQQYMSDREICQGFDHVDFYRVIYVAVRMRNTVKDGDNETALYHIVSILNYTPRPEGYKRVLDVRQSSASGGGNITTAELKTLFKVLSDQSCPTRDQPFQRVLEWASTPPHSPSRLLAGLDNTIAFYVAAGARAGTGLPVRFDAYAWLPYFFIYVQEMDGDPNVWYLENENQQAGPSQQAGSSQQPTKRHGRSSGGHSSGSGSNAHHRKKKRS